MFIRLFTIVLFSTVISANASATESGITLYGCNSMSMNSMALHTAATNVTGLGYVAAAINQAIAENGPGASDLVCYSGIPLKKNIYQYYKFILKFEVRAKEGGPVTHEFHMLYQDASTQANHGLEEKPWVGLRKSDVEKAFAEGLSDVPFALAKNQSTNDDIDYVRESNLYKNDFGHAVSSALYSYEIPGTERLSVSSWLVAVSNGVFAGSEVPEGVLVRHNPQGLVEVADVTWMASRFLFPLEDKIYQELRTLHENQYQARLLEFSRLNQ